MEKSIGTVRLRKIRFVKFAVNLRNDNIREKTPVFLPTCLTRCLRCARVEILWMFFKLISTRMGFSSFCYSHSVVLRQQCSWTNNELIIVRGGQDNAVCVVCLLNRPFHH